jgi:hypothetical protein
MPKYHITSPKKPEGAVFDEKQFAEFLVWLFKCQSEEQTKQLMKFRHELHEKGKHSFPEHGVEITVMESA